MVRGSSDRSRFFKRRSLKFRPAAALLTYESEPHVQNHLETYMRACSMSCLRRYACSAAVLACAMAWPETVGNLNVVAGISFTISVALLIYSRLNPDTVRRQSDTILKSRRKRSRAFKRVSIFPRRRRCAILLLPAIGAQAVAITDRESILGYAGDDEEISPGGAHSHKGYACRLKTASCVCWAHRKRLIPR